MKEINTNQTPPDITTITFDLNQMNAHLTSRQAKRIIRLHRRLTRRVLENSRPILKLKLSIKDQV